MKTGLLQLFCVALFAMLLCSIRIAAQSRQAAQFSAASFSEEAVLKKSLKSYRVCRFNTGQLNKHVKTKKKDIELNLVFDAENYTMALEESPVAGSGFYIKLFTDKGVDSLPYVCNTYKGYLKNDPDKTIRITVAETYLAGYIETPKGKMIIQPLSDILKTPFGKDDRLIVYKEEDIKSQANGACGTIASQASNLLQNTQIQNSARVQDIGQTNCRILELAADADYEWFQAFGSNSGQRIIDLVNIANGNFVNTFNISIYNSPLRMSVEFKAE